MKFLDQALGLFWFLNSIVFKLALFVMGWRGTDDEEINALKSKSKCVFIFSHTSFWDLTIFFLYRLAYPKIGEDMYTIVTPWAFDRPWRARLLAKCNCIKAPRLEDKGRGFVEYITRLMADKDRYFLMISPEGRLSRSPWRSGFFWIAERLGVPIRVVGLDYEKKRFSFGPPVFTYSSHNNFSELKSQMGAIVPLYPAQSFVPIRFHDPAQVSPINYSWFLLNVAFALEAIQIYRCIDYLFSFNMFLYLLPNVICTSLLLKNNGNLFLETFIGAYFMGAMFVHFAAF